MTKNDIVFLDGLWRRLIGDAFTAQKLAEQLKHDGGHDMANLSEGELLQLLNGRFSGDWKEPAFSFSELLAFYSVPDENRPKKQTVGWVCASFIITDAIKQGATDWELQFDKLIDGFLAVRNDLETEEAVHVFQRVFRCDDETPRPNPTGSPAQTV
jgi:hypothetical protein